MSSFQERFKGKSSVISKEGLISSLDKPPVSKAYVQKDQVQSHSQSSQRMSSTPPTSNDPSNSRFSSNAFYRDTHGEQFNSIKDNSALRPSKQNNVQVKNELAVRPPIASEKKAPLPPGGAVNRQKNVANTSSNTINNNNSNTNNMSHQQRNQTGLDPYLAQNPFSLNEYQGGGGLGGQRRNSNSDQRQYEHQIQAAAAVGATGNKQSHSPKRSQDAFYAGYENQPRQLRQNHQQALSGQGWKNQQYNQKIQMNSTDPVTTSAYNSNPYSSYNPYTLDAIELNNVNKHTLAHMGGGFFNGNKKLERRKNNNINNQNALNMKENAKNQFNSAEKPIQLRYETEEREANEFIQSYIPSFGSQDHTSSVQVKASIDLNAMLPQRGGLGANIGTEEWNSKKERQDKMLEYSAQVKMFNQQVLPPSNVRRPKPKEEETKVKSAREKAMEFAKNVPKPKVKADDSSPKQSNNNGEQGQPSRYPTRRTSKSGSKQLVENSEIDELERQHLEYLNKINSLNINN